MTLRIVDDDVDFMLTWATTIDDDYLDVEDDYGDDDDDHDDGDTETTIPTTTRRRLHTAAKLLRSPCVETMTW